MIRTGMHLQMLREKEGLLHVLHRSLDLAVALTDGVVYTINGNTAFMNSFVHKSLVMEHL